MNPGPHITHRRLAGPGDLSALAIGAAIVALLLQRGRSVALEVPSLLMGPPRRGILPGSVARFGADDLGRLVLAFAIFGALSLSLHRFGSRRLRLTRVLFGIDGLLLLGLAVCLFAGEAGAPALTLPVAVWGLWVLGSFGIGPALLSSLALVALLSVFAGAAPGWQLLLRALIPTVLMRKSHRAQTGFVASAGSGFLVATILMIQAGTTATVGTSWPLAAQAILGGALDGLLFVLGRTSAESALGHVSRERLHDLLDLKQPLLCRMMELAPGSFEHSRAMANLAEQAASAIGADALLIRVGAYYHDLGKSCRPDHFIENLEPGQPSPHAELSPLESARRIQNHVSEGIRLLREGGVPEPVVEFAYTHHGTQRVEYFFNRQKQLAAASGEPIDEDDFRYPGMKPMTRETAILMLVDSIEAASRTLESPDQRAIEEMLRRIVFGKLNSGQLDDSGLTMKDLRVACERVAWTLAAMNHHRIKYPWQEEKRPVSALPDEPDSATGSASESSSPSRAKGEAETDELPSETSTAAKPQERTILGGLRAQPTSGKLLS